MASPLTDHQMLEILHKKEVEGMTAISIAQEMGGRTRNSVLGVIHRVNRDTDQIPCKCRRKANRDGGMKPGWWRERKGGVET